MFVFVLDSVSGPKSGNLLIANFCTKSSFGLAEVELFFIIIARKTRWNRKNFPQKELLHWELCSYLETWKLQYIQTNELYSVILNLLIAIGSVSQLLKCRAFKQTARVRIRPGWLFFLLVQEFYTLLNTEFLLFFRNVFTLEQTYAYIHVKPRIAEILLMQP